MTAWRAELLRAVRARVHLRNVRGARKTLAPMVPPSPAGYAAELMALSRRSAMLIRSILLPVLHHAAAARTDSVARTDAAEDEIKAAFARLRLALEGVAHDAPRIAKLWAGRTAGANQAAMNRQFRAILPLDVFHSSRAVEDRTAAAAARNVKLIKTIPTRLLDDVEAQVLPRVQAGVRVEETAAVLEERFAISERSAARIARTETSKLNAELTQTRHEEIGIGTYTWHTAGDERVRGNPFGLYPKSKDNHWRLQGRVCTYDNPPVVDETTGRACNPGEDYECRCQALPNVSDFLSALEAEDTPGASDLAGRLSDFGE